MNRKTRRAFVTLFRRRKLRLMRPLVSASDFAFICAMYPGRV